MAAGTVLQAGDIKVGRTEAATARTVVTVPAGMTLAGIEKEALLQALRRNDGNRQMTADELGISTRTIQRKIQEYSLPF